MKRSVRFNFLKRGFAACFFAWALFAGGEEGDVAGEFQELPPSRENVESSSEGFSVELLKTVLEKNGVAVSFSNAPDSAVRCDMGEGPVNIFYLVYSTPEQENFLDFTAPYLTLHRAIFLREDMEDVGEEGLREKSVAVLAGDAGEACLRSGRLAGKIISVDSCQEAFELLAEDEADAAVLPKQAGLAVLEQSGLPGIWTDASPTGEIQQKVCFAVEKGNGALLDLLNAGLAQSHIDGTYDRLRSKWFWTEVQQNAVPQTIVVGGSWDFPPFEFLDETGAPSGYNVELTHAIARAMGINVRIMLGPWMEILGKLKNGEIDVLQGMYYSPERDVMFDFSMPHLLSRQAVFSHSESGVCPGMDALKNRRVAVMRGDILHEYALQKGLSNLLIFAESEESVLDYLDMRVVDFAFASHLSGTYWIAKKGMKNLQEVVPFEMGKLEYCYAVNQGNNEVLDYFNDGLALLKANSEYRRIKNRWFGVGSDAEVKEPPRSQWVRISRRGMMVFAVLVLMLGFSLLWLRLLNRQVAKKTAELTESEEKYSLL
ncbi:MAG: transporter substrate-binding domain-containing protein, partial [Pontiellaceae bacterium]|nr:transporter substrate-binding domain-containing protein [Pontiellaceae bacterium]